MYVYVYIYKYMYTHIYMCVFDFSCFVITRHHKLRFSRHVAEAIPTSLPELPIQRRDLRNNQKSYKALFIFPL